MSYRIADITFKGDAFHENKRFNFKRNIFLQRFNLANFSIQIIVLVHFKTPRNQKYRELLK